MIDLTGIAPKIKEYFKDIDGIVNFYEPDDIPLELLMLIKRGEYVCQHKFYLYELANISDEVFTYILETELNEIEKAFKKAKQ